MIIEVDEHGRLEVDSVEKSVDQFDQKFLEGLVEDSLEGKVEFRIKGVTPISKFFKTIEEGTAPGSDLKKLQEEVAAKKARQSYQGDDSEEAPGNEAIGVNTASIGSCLDQE